MTKRLLLVAPPRVDRRNERYPAKAVVSPQPNKGRVWAMGPVLDQGQTQHCLGFSWTAVLMGAPNGDLGCSVAVGNAYGHNHTERAGGYRGVADVALERGAITAYHWAEDLEDVRNAVIGNGPVQVSVPWYTSMSSPNMYGRLIVKPHASPGFHALAIHGYNPNITLGSWRGPAFKVRNSWGRQWGMFAPGWRKLKPWRRKRTGDAWITLPDFDRLMKSGVGYNQMACIPVGKTGVSIASLLSANPDPKIS